MQKKYAVLFSVAALLLTACHSSKQSIGSTADIIGGNKTLYQFKWYVTNLQGQPVTSDPDALPYLVFKQGRTGKVTGNTGCNNFNGTFVLSGNNKIKFSPLATTRMACLGNNTETSFLNAMSQADSWIIVNNQLSLNNGNNVLIKFSGTSLSTKSSQ